MKMKRGLRIQWRGHRGLGLGAAPKPSEIYDRRGRLREGRTATNKDADKQWLGAQKKQLRRKWLLCGAGILSV